MTPLPKLRAERESERDTLRLILSSLAYGFGAGVLIGRFLL